LGSLCLLGLLSLLRRLIRLSVFPNSFFPNIQRVKENTPLP
jgi:hypothetical protein